MSQLTQLGVKYNTDKSTYHNYTDFYDSLFGKNKDDVAIFVEVGIEKGGSIRMWRDYFRNSKIFCYDFNLDCINSMCTVPNVVAGYMDQSNIHSVTQAASSFELNSIDILIDDGGHFSTQQRNTLNAFWPYLKTGGIYVVEDIHTNVKHWYPYGIVWNNNQFFWDESPTLLETLSKIQYGVDIGGELNFPQSEIKQIIMWSQPKTTTTTCILIKN